MSNISIPEAINKAVSKFVIKTPPTISGDPDYE